MNTLTIPQLNLFNTKRTSPIKRDTNFNRNNLLDNNHYQYQTKDLYYSTRNNNNFINTANPTISSQSRYKQIAQHYLQKTNKLPSYYLQPTPYIYNIPSYLYHPSPQRKQKYPCQCQIQIPTKQSIDQKLNKNPYVPLKDQQLPTKQPKILKQPYLQATFRQRYQPSIQQKFISKQNSSKLQENQLKQQSAYHSKNLISEIMNSKIMQKLNTHQSNDQEESKIGPINNLITQKHQAIIQTQKPTNQSHLTNKTYRQKKQSKASVQKILQEQKLLIESLQMEFQKQNQFKIEVQDLESTKNDYIDRSKELLFKLNELADDKREFSFMFKAFSDKRKHNVFSSLQV